MNDFDDSYRAVPLHIMAASLIVMMILDFMPFSFDGFFWLPERKVFWYVDHRKDGVEESVSSFQWER